MSTLPATDFTAARNNLSELITRAVERHQPQAIRRRGDPEDVLLLPAGDLARSLQAFHFEPRVSISKDEATAALQDLRLLGFGKNSDEALADLLRELRLFTQRFFSKVPFYMETDRAKFLPWLLRFASTPEDEQLDLMTEEPSDSHQLTVT